MRIITREQGPSSVSGLGKPDQAYLLRFLFESFRHAQGSLETQLEAFRKVALMHPDWHITDEQKNLLKEVFAKRVVKFFPPNKTPPLHEKVKDPFAEAQRVIDGMQEKFNDNRNPHLFNINTFVGHLVGQDYAFIVENKRRPRGSKRINERNPILDPYLSFVGYYGIEGNSTGLVEFDDLYVEVKDAIINRPEYSIPQLRGSNWKSVVEKYVLTHPSKRPHYEKLGLVKPRNKKQEVIDRAKLIYLQLI